MAVHYFRDRTEFILIIEPWLDYFCLLELFKAKYVTVDVSAETKPYFSILAPTS